MNKDQELQNAKTLASLLAVAEDAACELLRATVQVTWPADDAAAAELGWFVYAMVRRTISQVGTPTQPCAEAAWELLVNGAAPMCRHARTLHAAITAHGFSITPADAPPPADGARPPRILCLYSACFAAAQLCHHALGMKTERVSAAGLRVDFREWPGVEAGAWDSEVEIGTVQVAGGGAVGNSFLYALQYLPVRGAAFLIDPKPVNGGILNRCMWFDEGDTDKAKVLVLAEKATKAFPNIEFTPLVKTVKEARGDVGGDFNCLVVGVDSRLARRNLQDEVPLEVFDASTTTVEEVVFHHSRQFDGHACMACVYFETAEERTFTEHVAEMLNVTVEDVQRSYVDDIAAEKIVARYPQLSRADVLGKAYDSLFKEMCATEQLKTPEEKQVLAPFAFVSQLAGTIMSIELFLRRRDPARAAGFNYWRASPWRSPVTELQSLKPRRPGCPVCSREDYADLASGVWAKYKE